MSEIKSKPASKEYRDHFDAVFGADVYQCYWCKTHTHQPTTMLLYKIKDMDLYQCQECFDKQTLLNAKP